MHAVVARNTFASQKCLKSNGLGPFLDVEMLEKIGKAQGAEHIPKSKRYNHTTFERLLGVQASFFMRGMDFAPLQNRAERVGFVAVSETIAGVGGVKGSANMHLAWKAHIIALFLRLAISNFGGSLAELLRLLMLSTSRF